MLYKKARYSRDKKRKYTRIYNNSDYYPCMECYEVSGYEHDGIKNYWCMSIYKSECMRINLDSLYRNNIVYVNKEEKGWI